MHPLKDDPAYAPCRKVIDEYQECNSKGVSRLFNQCQPLLQAMTDCMREQRKLRRQENAVRSKLRTEQRERITQDYALNWWESVDDNRSNK